MQEFRKIAFLGMGLINSSLARDLKKKKLCKELVATSRSKKTRNIVRRLKLVDAVYDTYENTVRGADLIVIGIPVDAYEGVFKKINKHLKSGAIITDVGSVKKEVIKKIQKIIPKSAIFIPGHPIAGTENSGPEAGLHGLFKNAWCILTPSKQTNSAAVELVKKLWLSVGMKVDIMDPVYHDKILAITSHIPHLVAYSIVGTVSNLEKSIKKEVIKYAASGFRDFTRIAASDPIMWRDILLLNSKSVLQMLKIFKKDLSTIESAIKKKDGKFLYSLFSKTRKIRKDIIS